MRFLPFLPLFFGGAVVASTTATTMMTSTSTASVSLNTMTGAGGEEVVTTTGLFEDATTAAKAEISALLLTATIEWATLDVSPEELVSLLLEKVRVNETGWRTVGPVLEGGVEGGEGGEDKREEGVTRLRLLHVREVGGR